MKKKLLYLFSFYLISGCTPPPSPSSYERSKDYQAINKTYTAGRIGASLRKFPKISTPISKNIQVGDTVYVYGRLNQEWYVVRRNGKRYFAPFKNIYPFNALETSLNAYKPIPDSSARQFIHIPLLAEWLLRNLSGRGTPARGQESGLIADVEQWYREAKSGSIRAKNVVWCSIDNRVGASKYFLWHYNKPVAAFHL